MRYSCARILVAALIFIGLTTPAMATDIEDIINEFRNGQLPISENETPILLPFATEWDSFSQPTNDSTRTQRNQEYHQLTVPDGDWLRASVEALISNDDAVEYYTSEETNAAFREVYEQARQSGAAVGLIPYEQAMRYWLLSSAVSLGPENLEAYPSGPNAQWCLPPIIRCGPSPPDPERQ